MTKAERELVLMARLVTLHGAARREREAQRVRQWWRRGIPAKYVPELSRQTGIPEARLNPAFK